MIVRAKGESVNLMLFSLKAPCTTGAVSLPTGNELEYPYATFNLLKIHLTYSSYEYSRSVPHGHPNLLSQTSKVTCGKLMPVWVFLSPLSRGTRDLARIVCLKREKEPPTIPTSTA